MRTIGLLAALLVLAASCKKIKEKELKISGAWDITETVITKYANNEPVGDSTVAQTGVLLFEERDAADNICSHTLSYAPVISSCYWEVPRKKFDQLFFYAYDENSLSIYSASCMVEKLTRKKLELVLVSYDSDLNILEKSVWRFTRREL